MIDPLVRRPRSVEGIRWRHLQYGLDLSLPAVVLGAMPEGSDGRHGGSRLGCRRLGGRGGRCGGAYCLSGRQARYELGDGVSQEGKGARSGFLGFTKARSLRM